MVLNEQEIRNLNWTMLGLGAPVDRDDQGYNKPDFVRMEPYGRYLCGMNAGHLYFILEALSHYKNTQLYAEAANIEDSLAYYRDEAKRLKKNKELEDKVENYLPKEIIFVGVKELQLKNINARAPLIVLKIVEPSGEKWDARRALVENKEAQLSIKDDTLWIAIPPSYYKWAMERLKQVGRYGYEIKDTSVIDANLDQWIDLYESIIANPPKRPVEIVSVSSSKLVIHFDGYLQAINDLKTMYSVRSINDNGQWNTEIPITLIDKVNAIFEQNGYETIDIKSVEDAAEKEKLAKLKAIEEEQERLRTWNVSNNTLVDWTQFPLSFKPYPYQLEDADKIVAHNRMLLGHDMGCGKTFIAGLVGESIPERKLAIVPESLRLNWKKELLQINPNADVKVLLSKDAFVLGNDWTIVGYSTVQKLLPQLIAANIQCVFIDEAHRCKSVDAYGRPNSKRAKAVMELCANVKYCYPMTGTPIPTSNKDLYNIMRMLQAPEIITGDQWDYMNFGKTFCDGYNNGYGWNFTGSSNNDKLHEILSKYMVRRLKKDVLPHLTKQRVFIPIHITGREYSKIEKRLAESSGNSYDTYMALAMTGRRLMSKQKLEASIDLAEDILNNGGSVVIASEFNETLDEVMKIFDGDCCSIRGGMSDAAKQKAIDDFQSGNVHVCALNVIAGGVGVTLTKAHDMIVCDYDWTPANMSQVEDRICRAGQTDHCTIHYIYGENSTFDELFMEMITEKSNNIDEVVDAAENTMDFNEEAKSKASMSFIQRLMKKYA